jgi:BlaI family transcriptional regulator, penicillinase repressor
MMATTHELSAAEWELMAVIWEAGAPMTVREMMDSAYPNDEKAYTTVQTLMNILVEKGVLRREKVGPVNVYTAVVRREQVLDASMSTVADRMFRGNFGAMASFLVNRKLGEEDIAALRRLLAEQEDGGNGVAVERKERETNAKKRRKRGLCR